MTEVKKKPALTGDGLLASPSAGDTSAEFPLWMFGSGAEVSIDGGKFTVVEITHDHVVLKTPGGNTGPVRHDIMARLA